MAVDVGESLVQSWLRHVKRCDIVQTNWKSAFHFGMNRDKADDLLVKIKNDFAFFGKQSAGQIIRQLEIDALGCIIDDKKYIACDIAFHEDGLHYRKGEDTVPSKMLRTILCLYAFIEAKEAEIVFATPGYKSASDRVKLETFVKDLNDCLQNKWGLSEYRVKLYAEHEFETNILNPVLRLTDVIKDTSEVFVRACQLIRAARVAGAKASASPDCVTAKVGPIDVSELKSQDLIEQFVLPILSKMSKSALKPYFDRAKSAQMFGCGYAFLNDKKEYTTGNRCRYYATAYYLEKAKQSLYVTNDCDRPKIIEWINNNVK